MLHHRLRAAAGNAGIPEDYIALWDMAGNALDETGDYNISLFGGAVQQADHISFDGVDDYGQTPRLALNNNKFTIGVRFRLTQLDQDNGAWIINSRSSGTGSAREFQIIYFPTSSTHIILSAYSDNGNLYNVESVQPEANQWYSLVFSLTGDTIEAWDSSGLLNSVGFFGSMNTSSTNTIFARRGWSDTSTLAFADVDVSRTVVYDYDLNGAEIQSVIDFLSSGGA